MATDEAKKLNALRMLNLSMEVLASEVWDTFGESSMAMTSGMGDALLEMVEKEQGLEIAGEDPVAIAKELNRILVDEYGYAQSIDMKVNGAESAEVTIKGCINTYFTEKLLKTGVKVPFTCPMMLLGTAMLRRLGVKNHVEYAHKTGEKVCVFHYKAA
jgi:hypothetical protein